MGCSNRKRTNPLDPRNPDTQGRLQGLWVSSEKHDVTLNWDPLIMHGILGFHIYRRYDQSAVFENIDFVPSGVSFYTDSGLPYEEKVLYRVSVVTPDYESPLSDSISITPGPYNYWVLDSYLGEVIRLTYDGSHIITRSRFSTYPVALAVDSVSKTVWVVDLMGYIFQISSDNQLVSVIEGLTQPSHIAFQPKDGLMWVGNANGTRLVQMDTAGVILWEVDGFQSISDLEYQGLQGKCWVADEGSGEVSLFSSGGALELRREDPFQYPKSISYYREGGWLWVADSLHLYRIWPNGNVEETVELQQPIYSISVDQTSGECWAILILDDGSENEIIKVGVNGDIIVRARGFYLARDVIANDFNGGCLVADTGNYRVVRLAKDGTVIGFLDDFGAPGYLAVE